ncbi:hypothetical protein IHE45_11G036000 [Dioscorea alata]|uniref:Uncharacterized protein n=1 Tax=Dioscorea alata TaxID=55571 RepID=A0ACB7V5V2_DIOAL|nr:hypothetical protein IHE45_11G036000 [Dioscorea alata]
MSINWEVRPHGGEVPDYCIQEQGHVTGDVFVNIRDQTIQQIKLLSMWIIRREVNHTTASIIFQICRCISHLMRLFLLDVGYGEEEENEH